MTTLAMLSSLPKGALLAELVELVSIIDWLASPRGSILVLVYSILNYLGFAKGSMELVVGLNPVSNLV